MVRFSVFNELSLPLSNESLFGPFFQVLERLKAVGLDKIRMDREFTYYPEILPNTTLQEFFGQLQDRDKKTKLRSFINNGISIIESPLINDEEIDILGERIEPQYVFEKHSTFGGLASADIWGTVAVSFQSDDKWGNFSVELHKGRTIVSVKHISDPTHMAMHQDFFNSLEECIQLDLKPSNFWEKKDDLFKNKIIFCEEVKKQITTIDTTIFSQAISILRDIENEIKSLLDLTTSSESSSVKQDSRLKKLREFEIDGKKEYFQNHIKNLSNGYRIYYFEKNDKIYIGYIGKHLKTKKND